MIRWTKYNNCSFYFTHIDLPLLLLGYLYFKKLYLKVLHVYQNKLLLPKYCKVTVGHFWSWHRPLKLSKKLWFFFWNKNLKNGFYLDVPLFWVNCKNIRSFTNDFVSHFAKISSVLWKRWTISLKDKIFVWKFNALASQSFLFWAHLFTKSNTHQIRCSHCHQHRLWQCRFKNFSCVFLKLRKVKSS